MMTSRTFPTDAQIAYASDLLDKKDLFAHPGFFDRVNGMDAEEFAAYIAGMKRQMPELSRQRVSEIIDTLKALPNKSSVPPMGMRNYTDDELISLWSETRDDRYQNELRRRVQAKTAPVTIQPAATEAVPAGRYAIPTPHAANEHSFFKVDRPTEGRWAGYVFVKQQISDEEIPIKNAAGRRMVLESIMENGIEESMLLYGQLIGACGHCGRTLTNDLSRELGIGPVCRERMGF